VDAPLPLLLIAAVAFIVWKVLSGNASTATPRASSSRAKAQPVRESQEHHWSGKGDFEFEIVGESHYQAILARLAGQHGAESVEKACRAVLLLEDDNSHDPKAVAVRIDEKTVGYLAREDARSYRRRLGQKRLSGVNATCDALVVGGGTRHNGEKLFYGVKLDIKPFD
jgi:hypothetical protein